MLFSPYNQKRVHQLLRDADLSYSIPRQAKRLGRFAKGLQCSHWVSQGQVDLCPP